MQLIKQLARELAQRDVTERLSPASTIEEMKTVLAAEIHEHYVKAFAEIGGREVRRLRRIPAPVEAETYAAGVLEELIEDVGAAFPQVSEPEQAVETARLISDHERAALALVLQEAADGGVHLTPDRMRACARAVRVPTKRELDLDAILHSGHMEKVLDYAEGAIEGWPGEAARRIRTARGAD